MSKKFEFTDTERQEYLDIFKRIHQSIGESFQDNDEENIREHLKACVENGQVDRDVFGLNPLLNALQTAEIAVQEIGLKRDGVIAILLHQSVVNGILTIEEVGAKYGDTVAHIIHGLVKIDELYRKNPVIESENFRNLLLSFAEDMRVSL